MKYFFRTLIFLAIGIFLIACGQSTITTPLPLPSPSETPTPAFNYIPTQTPTATLTPIPTKTHLTSVRPSPIPTIDPLLVDDLLRNAFSIQTLEGVNDVNIRQITGWDYGFGGGVWTGSCDGFYWLDEHHLLLYPAAGEVIGPEGYWANVNIVPQPVIINVESGNIWTPPVNRSPQPTCNWLFWSQELGIIITPEIQNDVSTVSIYTYDGKKLASYSGKLLSTSPSRTKLVLTDNTLIDLRTNKKIKLNWSLEGYDEEVLSKLFWTSDEMRIYRCCYFFADLKTETSFRYGRSDFLDKNGNSLNYKGIWMQQGFWVLDDTYFLVWWQAVDDGDVKYLPLIDPATKTLYDVRELAGIPDEFTSNYTPISPDGNYVWMEGWNESYLVNLNTFQTQHFTYSNPYSYTDSDWSSDSNFVWFQIYDSNAKSAEFDILSITDMKLHPLSVIPQGESEHWWHSTDNIVIYPAKDRNSLVILDAATMSFRELPFKNQGMNYKVDNLAWNPSGDKIAFVTEGSSLWLVDYPSLENLEQVLSTVDRMVNLQWSPDGKSISFISDSKIYIVDTTP